MAKRTIAGIEAARALSGDAVATLSRLVTSRSPRIAFEASKLVLAYSWGAPRQMIELSGGFSDLSKELSLALQAVRERRALEAQGVLEGQIATPASPRASLELERLEVGGVASPCEVVAPDAAVPGAVP